MSEQSRQSQATERQGGRLIVLTGPTAVGKGTVETALRKAHPEVWVSVSATTRDPRPGERDGVNYWFISEPEFLRRQEAGEFLETAVVHGMAHYGTPLEPVREHLAGNVPTILEIDLRVRAASRSARRNSDSTWFTCSSRHQASTSSRNV